MTKNAGRATGLLMAPLVLAMTIATGLGAGEAARAAGDAKAGATKAAVCAACHGPQGISVNPLWPNLAGQQEVYLDKQIKAFRDGSRVEPTMQPFVQNLSDQDVADLAAYYANLPACLP